tara:strand:+ start:276 stop:602 length:327 start_codon:yes stop_codon:yes gene_type:complete
MRFVKVKNREVVEIRNEMADGFVYAKDEVSGGWILKDDGEFYPPEMSDEKKLALLRQQRNYLLSQTDWMAVQDRKMSQKEIEYRQALRDITKKYKSLDDAVFPTLGEE